LIFATAIDAVIALSLAKDGVGIADVACAFATLDLGEDRLKVRGPYIMQHIL